MGVARPKERADQVPAFAVEDEQGMVDVLFVVAVVVATFLIAVGGICGRVEVQEYLFRSSVLASLLEVELEECLGHPVASASGGRVLQPGDSGLARQIRPALGHRPAQELEQGVFAQGVRVVLVLVAASYLKDALLDESFQRMAPFALPPLRHVLGYPLAQRELGVCSSQPHEPAI